MKRVCLSLVAVGLLFLATPAFSQNDLLSEMPKKKEDYAKTETQVINTINWLESTPIKENTGKRKEQTALLIAWATGTPSVSIQIEPYVTTLSEKNPDLLALFIGGWIKYSLENDYSKDPLKCNTAGVESAVKLYKLGGMKKDKKVQKLVNMYDEGTLEDWVKKQLGKQ
ncbi:MAG: hypothetical protein AAFX87_16885 [Bacteroidota bacterium]